MTEKLESKARTPEAHLRSFIERLDPTQQKLFRSVRAALRKRFPTANEMVYDYSHSLVIGYSPTDKGIDSVVSIATRDGGVRLYFANGPHLPDPMKLLMGSAKTTRYVRVEAASRLAHPDVDALIVAAVERATLSLPSEGKGKVIIRTGAGK